MAAKIILVLCFATAYGGEVYSGGLTPLGYGVGAYDPASLASPYRGYEPALHSPYKGLDASLGAPYNPQLSYALGFSHPIIRPLQPAPSAASLLYPFPQAPAEIPFAAYAQGPVQGLTNTGGPAYLQTTPSYATNPLGYALGGVDAARPQNVLGTVNYNW